MKRLIIAALIGAGLVAASNAEAKADPYSPCQYYSQCQPPWNGQLMPTWDTPGYYGGWNTGPESCSPFTLKCQGTVPDPNGGNG